MLHFDLVGENDNSDSDTGSDSDQSDSDNVNRLALYMRYVLH